MLKKEDCLLLGTVIKTTGIRGEIITSLQNLSFERIKKMGSVFLDIEGLLVPFFIEEYFQPNENSLVIKFDDIHSKEKAREIVGCDVYIEQNLVKEPSETIYNLSELKGYSMIDKNNGEIGIVEDTIDIPGNPLIKIFRENKEILIPVNEKIILEVNSSNKQILADLPEGLFDLND
ncbi:MAG: 16S rRNA processing protein RimM [Bacteroidales bacterium]|nr:16S rRNA processing protein RimM [Bacteroidales bacterium]